MTAIVLELAPWEQDLYKDEHAALIADLEALGYTVTVERAEVIEYRSLDIPPDVLADVVVKGLQGAAALAAVSAVVRKRLKARRMKRRRRRREVVYLRPDGSEWSRHPLDDG